VVVIRHAGKTEPVVWVIDSEQWPRACLRAELIERGYNAYGFIRIADAFESLSSGRSPKPEAIVLELRGQTLTNTLTESLQELESPIILLGGALELNDPLIQEHMWNTVLKRPFSLGTVADRIETLVPLEAIRERHP